MDDNTIGRRTPYTQFLIQALRDTPEGEILTYDKAQELTGLSKSKMMPYLYSALDAVLRDYGLVFECERTVGYTRLQQEVIPGKTNAKNVKKMRRQVVRYRDTLETVDPSTLSPQAQTERTLGFLNCAIMEGVVARKSQTTFKKTIQSGEVKLPDRDAVIKMFKGSMKGL